MGVERTLDAAGRAFGQFGEVLHKGKTIRSEADERATDFAQTGDRAQHALNLEAVKTGSVFLAGWRPALGWLCVLTLGYSVLLQPILGGLLPWLGRPDMTVIMSLLPVLLGSTALRTYEKVRGVQTEAMMSPRQRRKWWRRKK